MAPTGCRLQLLKERTNMSRSSGPIVAVEVHMISCFARLKQRLEESPADRLAR